MKFLIYALGVFTGLIIAFALFVMLLMSAYKNGKKQNKTDETEK